MSNSLKIYSISKLKSHKYSNECLGIRERCRYLYRSNDFRMTRKLARGKRPRKDREVISHISFETFSSFHLERGQFLLMCAKISFEFLSLLARLELSDHYIMKTRKKGSFLGLLTMPYVKESIERGER